MLSDVDASPLADAAQGAHADQVVLDPLLQVLPLGLVHCRLIRDDQNSVTDVVLTRANPTAGHLLSLAPGALVGMRAQALEQFVPALPRDWPSWLSDLAALACQDDQRPLGGERRPLGGDQRPLGGGARSQTGSLCRHICIGPGLAISITAYSVGPDECGLLIADVAGSLDRTVPTVPAATDSLLGQPGDLVALIDRDYRYVASNAEYAAHVGLRRSGVAGLAVAEVLGEDRFEREVRPLLDSASAGNTIAVLTRHFDQGVGSERYLRGRYAPVPGSCPAVLVSVLLREVIEPLDGNAEHAIVLELQRLLAASTDTNGLASDVVNLLRAHCGYEAVAVHLPGAERPPYSASVGLTPEFVAAAVTPEGSDAGLAMLRHMSTRVAQGATEAGRPHFSESGSFWTSGLTDWLSSADEADLPPGVSNRANGTGYESVAIIPVRVGTATGLLQVCDGRRDALDGAQIAVLERVATGLAFGIAQGRPGEEAHPGEAEVQAPFTVDPDGVMATDAASIICPPDPTEAGAMGITAEEAAGEPGRGVQDDGARPERQAAAPHVHLGDAAPASASPTAVESLGEPEALSIDDILDREALWSLFEGVYPITKVAVAITDLEGRSLLQHGFQEICDRFHRGHPVTRARCEYSDAKLSRGIGPGAVKMYRCVNNLWSSGTPIVVAGVHVGNLLIGQFFFDDETVDYEYYRRQARQYGFDEARYIAALDQIPRVRHADVDAILAFYGKLAVLVSSLTHSNLRLSRALSDRDRLLGEVQRSEERYRVVVENAEEAIYVAQDGLVRFANSRAAQALGRPLEDIVGAPVERFVHPDDEQMIVARHRRRLEGAPEPTNYTFRVIRADGEVRWAAQSLVPIEWEGRAATLNFTSDITERKLAEDSAAASQERFRRLAETIPLGIQEIDPEGRILYVNPAYLRMYACTPEAAVGSFAWDTAVDPEAMHDYVRRHREEQPVPEPWFGQDRAADGRVLDIRADWNYQFGEDGSIRGATAIITDITVQRQLEAQLLQAQKMESVGRLAGGVAHDFNNLLTAISGFAELALDRLAPNDEVRADIQEVLRNARRASDLTRQLLAFSRKQTMSMRPVDLNALVLDLGKLLRRLIGEHIELVLLPADPLPLVLADAAQIEQVIVNLAVNARDAMQSGGHLTIRTATTSLPAGVAALHPDLTRGPYVLLEVSDTGSGMSADVMEHLFEPFYTTKDPDKGTGLGLATVYGIVSQHGGHVAADSKPGAGSTFRIYLPLGDESLGQDKIQQSSKSTHGGGETILIVEDEPQVRAVERRTLQRLGYRVMEAANGEEALRLVSSLERLPDLVVTDMVMPRMGGVEMAAKLGDLYPGLRCLFTSGYADDAHDLKLATGSGHYLHKPFSAQALGDAVRRALEAPSNPPPAGPA